MFGMLQPAAGAEGVPGVVAVNVDGITVIKRQLTEDSFKEPSRRCGYRLFKNDLKLDSRFVLELKIYDHL